MVGPLCRIGRDRFAAFRFKVHTEKARVLQRVGRGYMGRRRAKGLRIRMRHVMASIRSVLQQDSDVAMSFKRITIETYSQPGADEWTLFHLCMCHLLGTQRLEIAVDLAILLCNKAPNFGPAKFAYLCCLLSAWPDVGKAHVVREDWLEEALFLLLQLREKGKGFNLLGSLATEVTPHRQGGILSQHLSLDMLPVTVSTPAGLADRDAGFRPRDSPSTTSLSRRPSESSASRLVSLGWTLDGGDSEVPISLDMTVSDADDETFTTRGREYSFRTAGRDGGIYIPVSSFDGLDFNGEAWHSQASHIEVDIESSTSSICADGSIAYNEYEEYPHKALESEKALGGVVSSIVGRRDGEVAAVDDVPQPPWMNSIDPVAVFFDGIIEEIEYMFFRNCLVRYDKNLANLIQMSACVFAVNAPTLGDGSSGDLAVVRVPTRDGQRTPTGELETELRVMDMRGRGAGIGRARRLLNRASKLVGQVDAESMTYRMQVLENIFEAQHKEIFRQRKQLKDVSAGVFEARYICEYLKAVHEIEFEEFDSLELDAKAESNIVKIAASKGSKLKSTEGKKVADTKDKYKSNENKDQRMLEVFKVSADIVCYRCGEAMMVTAQLVVVGAHNNKPIATGTPKSTPHIPKQPTVAEKKNQEPVYQIYGTKGDKWLNNMVARPLVLLPHEVEAMHEQAIPFFCQALSQDEGSVRMRGRWKNIAEYIMQFIRVVSCGVQQSYSKTSIFEPHLSNAMRASKSDLYRPTQDTPISSDVESFAKEAPRSSFPTSRVRVCLPMIEYRRRERNSVRVESTAIVLLQRAYRGFRSRALKRRLKARLFEDMRQSNRDRDQVTALAKVRRRRYLMAALIQSIMR